MIKEIACEITEEIKGSIQSLDEAILGHVFMKKLQEQTVFLYKKC